MSNLEVPSERARAAPAIRTILFDADGVIQHRFSIAVNDSGSAAGTKEAKGR